MDTQCRWTYKNPTRDVYQGALEKFKLMNVLCQVLVVLPWRSKNTRNPTQVTRLKRWKYFALKQKKKYLPFSRSWWVPKLGNYYAKLLLQICEGIIWDYLAIMFVFLGRVSFTVGTTFWCRDWVIYCKINLPSRIRVKTASKSLSREWTVGFKWPLALRCLFFTTLSISNQNYNRKARREIFDWAGSDLICSK
jgi:hypothetical protein